MKNRDKMQLRLKNEELENSDNQLSLGDNCRLSEGIKLNQNEG